MNNENHINGGPGRGSKIHMERAEGPHSAYYRELSDRGRGALAVTQGGVR